MTLLKKTWEGLIETPTYNHVTLFVDEAGHLCVKDDLGTVLYVVLSTTPPVTGATVMPPDYTPPRLGALPAPEAPPLPAPSPPALPAEAELWDHLHQD